MFLCICCLGKLRMHVAGASSIVICKRLNLDLVPVHTPAHFSGLLLRIFLLVPTSMIMVPMHIIA